MKTANFGNNARGGRGGTPPRGPGSPVAALGPLEAMAAAGPPLGTRSVRARR